MRHKLSDIDALLNQKYVDCRIDDIPATIRCTYSAIDSKKDDILLSRELRVYDKVIFGIEYTPEGEIASLYKEDDKGQRITHRFNNADKDRTPAEFIEKQMEFAQKLIHKNEQQKNNTSSKDARLEPVLRTPDNRRTNSTEDATSQTKKISARRINNTETLRRLDDYRNNRRA